MLVRYVGSGKLIMTDYNGKRYTFEKDNPKEITPEIFNHIVASGLIEAKELEIIIEKPKPVEQPETQSIAEVKENKKGKKK